MRAGCGSLGGKAYVRDGVIRVDIAMSALSSAIRNTGHYHVRPRPLRLPPSCARSENNGHSCQILSSILDRREERAERRATHIAELRKRASEADAKLKRLYDAIENGVADLSDPMLRIASPS